MIRTLIEEHRDAVESQVRRIAQKRTKDVEAAEDIVQEVWLVVLTKTGEDPEYFVSKARLVAFVTVTAGYKCKEYWRKQGRTPATVKPTALDTRAAKFVDPDWHRIRERVTCQRIFDVLIAQLSRMVAVAEVVRMRCEGLQWQEIVSATGRSEATVRRNYDRGLSTLQILAAEGELEAV